MAGVTVQSHEINCTGTPSHPWQPRNKQLFAGNGLTALSGRPVRDAQPAHRLGDGPRWVDWTTLPTRTQQAKVWPNSCRRVLPRDGATSAWSGLVGRRCNLSYPRRRPSQPIAAHDDVVGQGEKGEEAIARGRRPPVPLAFPPALRRGNSHTFSLRAAVARICAQLPSYCGGRGHTITLRQRKAEHLPDAQRP